MIKVTFHNNIFSIIKVFGVCKIVFQYIILGVYKTYTLYVVYQKIVCYEFEVYLTFINYGDLVNLSLKIEWITKKTRLKPFLLIDSPFLLSAFRREIKKGERIKSCRTFIDFHQVIISKRTTIEREKKMPF